MSFTDDHSSLPAGTIEWMERLRDPDEYSRALLRISPDKKWTKEDHKNPEYLARAFLLIEKVAKENAPTGVDPYEVDEVDVKAALLLGFSKEAATEHGRKEAVSRILKYTGDGIRKMEAKQEVEQRGKEGKADDEEQHATHGDATSEANATSNAGKDSTPSTARDAKTLAEGGSKDDE